MNDAGKYFTVVFIGDVKKLEGNPFWFRSDFGEAVSIADGDALDELDELKAADSSGDRNNG